MGFFGWLCSHKLLIVFLAATTAFGIATITLAVEKSDLKDDLAACQAEVTTEFPESSTDSSTQSSPPTTESPAEMDYRLPPYIVPISYDIYLNPDLATNVSVGKLVVAIEVKEETTEIKMHSKRLIITDVKIGLKQAKVVDKLDFELIVISLEGDDKIIKQGQTEIAISFTGSTNNGMVGLYRSFYTEGGEQRAIATSKFEPTYARLAFPCFDEPGMKATYTVHLEKPKDNYIALSNMPEATKEEGESGTEIVTFQPSVPMSTYLVCFIVCDFKYKDGIITSPLVGQKTTALKVYSTPAQVDKTEYALTVAKKVIEYFIGYFNIEYPLPKLDLIAIPDFVSGAMEHWGLVTFRETALLFEETTSSAANQQRVAGVVAHELAHSWFGNLVTMQWWNDLWLNEGFATFIASKGVHAVHNDWNMLDQFLIDDLHSALSVDATPASHPIVTDVLTPNEITEVFDSITYKKGASVLRMLEGSIGEEIFKGGVTAYLNEHQFGNAVTNDLWIKIQELAGEKIDIKSFMDTWTEQMGYPILTVTEDGDNYVVTQKRFFKDKENQGKAESPHGYKWTVPLTYITDKKPVTLQWFKLDEPDAKIAKPTDAKWIKFNPGQVGYYRVNYPENLWKLLSENIKDMEIADKTHLLEESFSIAESGDLDYSFPLDLTKYLTEERNYVPWSAASAKLEQLKKYLIDSPQYSNYLTYVTSIVKPAYTEISWTENPESDSHITRRARVTVLDLACAMNYGDCLKEASERFEKWIANPAQNPLSQDLRSIVYKYGIQQHGQEEWEEVFLRFKNEIDANEKIILMRALAAVKEPWLLKRLIEEGKDKTVVRDQDYLTMLQYIAGNPIGSPIVWDFVREEWNYLVNRYGLDDRYLGRLIPAITGSFTTNIKLKELKAFFVDNPEAGAGAAAREEALANVIYNINWVKNNKLKVEKWIKENLNSPK